MIERACPNCRTGPVDVPEPGRWMSCMFCDSVWRVEVQTQIIPGRLWRAAWDPTSQERSYNPVEGEDK